MITSDTDVTPKPAADYYNIPYWSDGYVSVNKAGELSVQTDSEALPHISLVQVVEQLQKEQLRLPTLLRFPNILHHRIQFLVDAFSEAQQSNDYSGGYTPVYPIKVNQQKPVVEQIIQGQIRANLPRIGLEAGSKPELLAVLAQLQGHKGLIVCNGYKDSHFIRLALMAEKMGHHVFLVIEKLSELPKILQEADALGVKPRLGVRSRLATIGRGNWQNTGGEKSKFGLSSYQILQVVEQLRTEGRLDTLQLLHFHLGSQLANIRDIHNGLRECRRMYAELIRLDVPLGYLDVGGGLGVDYEGTRSRSYCSMNYSIREYARNVVSSFKEICQELEIPEPHIITESGRAMTAHHAILLAEIIDIEQPHEGVIQPPNDGQSLELQSLHQAFESLQSPMSSRSLVELYHDVQHWIGDAQIAFTAGNVGLVQRAQIEAIYTRVCRELLQRLNPVNRAHRALIDELQEKQAEKIFVNFSLFQSLPDVWGIDQIFPIVPIAQLNEPIKHHVVVQDITCDSDGRIDQYVDADGVGNTLPLPSAQPGDILAACLVGAYQEILGDMHNLFGDTDAVDVVINKGNIEFANITRGDTIASVLDYVNYCPEEITQKLMMQVAGSGLSEQDQAVLHHELTDSLNAYTYLDYD